jgi:hypothetical protein
MARRPVAPSAVQAVFEEGMVTDELVHEDMFHPPKASEGAVAPLTLVDGYLVSEQPRTDGADGDIPTSQHDVAADATEDVRNLHLTNRASSDPTGRLKSFR